MGREYNRVGVKRVEEERIMDEVMTVEEIERRFPSEWILLEDPETDEMGRVLRGKAIYHSKDRDDVYRKDRQLRPRSAAYLYTGILPEDVAVAL